MSKSKLIQEIESKKLKKVPDFSVGDTVRVVTRIVEGEKERLQAFVGTVIARRGTGLGETFAVHRVAYGEGMERVFYLHSPMISKIEVVKEGDVRSAKLYRLRGTYGKAARVKGRVISRHHKGTAKGQQSSVEKEKAEEEPVQVAAEEKDEKPASPEEKS